MIEIIRNHVVCDRLDHEKRKQGRYCIVSISAFEAGFIEVKSTAQLGFFSPYIRTGDSEAVAQTKVDLEKELDVYVTLFLATVWLLLVYLIIHQHSGRLLDRCAPALSNGRRVRSLVSLVGSAWATLKRYDGVVSGNNRAVNSAPDARRTKSAFEEYMATGPEHLRDPIKLKARRKDSRLDIHAAELV
jgi:hypothetical protein